MKRKIIFLICFVIVLTVSACSSTKTEATSSSSTVSYVNDIQPIFNEKCTSCHGGKGGLSLVSYDGLVAGGFSGVEIVPGKPEESLLIQRITGAVEPRMPKGGSGLSQDMIDKISQWIKDGAANN